MVPTTEILISSVPPALLAATFDTLARFPLEQRLEPTHLIAISRRIGGSAAQSMALLTRIRAAAIVLCDPRWPDRMVYFKTCGRDEHCLFDAAILHVIATLPLTAELRFHSDDFLDAVLARTGASGLG